MSSVLLWAKPSVTPSTIVLDKASVVPITKAAPEPISAELDVIQADSMQVTGMSASVDGGEPEPPVSGFHVTIGGFLGSDGTAGKPWSFAEAMGAKGKAAVKAGDTIWFHGSPTRAAAVANPYTLTNPGPLVCTINTGTSANPIKIRSYPGDYVAIDIYRSGEQFVTLKNGLTADTSGDYIYWYDFEVYNSGNITRLMDNAEVGALSGRRGTFVTEGLGAKCINMIFHDMSEGLTNQHWGFGGEVYGCITYNNGLVAETGPGGPRRTREHGMYIQNQNGKPDKFFRDNVAFNNGNYGFHGYKGYSVPNYDAMSGMNFYGNLGFNNGWDSYSGYTGNGNDFLVGTWDSRAYACSNIEAVGNYTYNQGFGGRVEFGFGKGGSDGLLHQDNYWASGALKFNQTWTNITSSGNTAFTSISHNVPSVTGITTVSNPAATESNLIVVRPNAYAIGRAHIIIYNWEDISAAINVTLAGTGTHTGGASATVMTDSTTVWQDDIFVGHVIRNITQNAQATVTANTATTITSGALSGGKSWAVDDAYEIECLADGDEFEIHHMYDLWGTPIVDGTGVNAFSTGVDIPITIAASTTAPTHLGQDMPTPLVQTRQFAAYLLTKV